MPNRPPKTSPPKQAPTDPLILVRNRADALYRAAIECCRQHDRAAKLHQADVEPELEHKHLDALCAMCDGSLSEMSAAYEAAAANVHPDRDEAWWHKANGMWHASREYARRHAGCDAVSRKLSAKHDPAQLASMQLEYELEASALLALRHAADAYCKTRPELAQRGRIVRGFTDDAGRRWEVTLGKASWGTLVLLFSPVAGDDMRTSTLDAETSMAANAELDGLDDDELRRRLRDSRPWP